MRLFFMQTIFSQELVQLTFDDINKTQICPNMSTVEHFRLAFFSQYENARKMIFILGFIIIEFKLSIAKSLYIVYLHYFLVQRLSIL